jgi:hypothetical protein
MSRINGLINRTKIAAAGDEGHVGVVKPDGTSISIDGNGVISATGGGGGYAPDMDTIDLTDNDKLRLKGATGYVKTDGDQTVGGKKTFSESVSVTGAASKLTLAPGTPSSTVPGDNVKIAMGNNASGVTPGAGGDLSLVLYGTGTAADDSGLGMTNRALNIKSGNTTSVINHFVGTTNVCQMTATVVNNMVIGYRSSRIPVGTNGVAVFTTSGHRGIEFRANDTQVKQLYFNNAENGTWSFRDSQDGGETWSAWIDLLDSNTSGWL